MHPHTNQPLFLLKLKAEKEREGEKQLKLADFLLDFSVLHSHYLAECDFHRRWWGWGCLRFVFAFLCNNNSSSSAQRSRHWSTWALAWALAASVCERHPSPLDMQMESVAAVPFAGHTRTNIRPLVGNISVQLTGTRTAGKWLYTVVTYPLVTRWAQCDTVEIAVQFSVTSIS